MTLQEDLRYIEECQIKSRKNPKKVIKVNRGCYYLTVGEYLWHIVYCSEIDRWYCYTDDAKDMELDEARTKREQVAILLA